MWLPRILLFAIMALPLATSAGEPRRFAHYAHQRWIGSEAPVPVLAMAQGKDGYLWLATGDGLFRFDGIRFEQIEVEQVGGKHALPSALLVTRSGDVWTNFETSHRFAIYRKGALRIVEGITAPSRISEMVEGPDGSIWAWTANYDAELLRFHDGRWQTFNAADGLPLSNVTNMIVASDGAIWVACTSSVVRLAPGAVKFETVSRIPRGALSQDPEGRIWLSDDSGSYPITGPGGRGPPASLRVLYRTGGAQFQLGPLFDHEGNLWIATRYGGIKRLRAGGVAGAVGDAGMESFTSRDGLSSDVTNQVLQDREGNIWVATEVGLDRFRPATLIAEPALDSPAEFGDKLLEASDGSVYIGQARTIYRVRPGGMPEPILRDVVEPESLCEAPDGAIWVGFENQILVWANGRIRKTIERPDTDANHNIIYDCAFDRDGDYWISAAGSGLHRYRRGRWETLLEPGSRVDFYPTTMVRSPQGGVVVQSGDRLIWFQGSSRAITHLDFGGSELSVLTLHNSGDWVFSAGRFGLSRIRPGHTETAWAPEISKGSRINGIVQTPDGDTWLSLPKSLVRLRPPELESAFSSKSLPVPTVVLGPGDGLVSRPHSHTQRAMVRGGDGRLWVATETGTLWMDPTRLVRNLVPPNVAIRAINGDGRTFRDPATVRLPTSTANVEIDFAVLSFADPGRVRARYMLEGFDRGWIDPGARRQAFYTNLPPGTYRFRVVAANNDGVWNQTGGSLEFEIPPSFVQSVWFLLLCSAVALLSLLALYRFRMAQLAARIRNRLEERVAERERIARELHDTLLQGVQGLILRFQVVADRLTGEEKNRGDLEAALVAAEHVVVDARNRVRDLRVGEDTGDLCAIVENLVAETPFDQPLPVRVVVEGRPRPLHPLVAAEITRIVREALLNIAYHARASWAEIAIGFETRHLAVRLRDNGVGIPRDVLARGRKDGHFGMIGMRERAEKMGGSITIASGSEGGAEVTLAVPAKLAFAKRNAGWLAWLQRLLAGSPGDE